MFRPGSESYVSGTVEIVDDVDEKRRRWSGFFPYDATAFFGPPENDSVVLLKVRPTSAIVMTQDASGLHRQRWRASRSARAGSSPAWAGIDQGPTVRPSMTGLTGEWPAMYPMVRSIRASPGTSTSAPPTRPCTRRRHRST